MQFTEKEKQIMEYYKIPKETGTGEKTIIIFAEKNTTSVALGELVGRYSKTQQTIIDYDEDREEYVIRFTPKKYGDMEEAPEARIPEKKTGGCPYRLEKGCKLSELLE